MKILIKQLPLNREQPTFVLDALRTIAYIDNRTLIDMMRHSHTMVLECKQLEEHIVSAKLKILKDHGFVIENIT